MHLKRKKLGPTVDLREGMKERALSQAIKAEEGGKEEKKTPLIRKGKKTTALERGSMPLQALQLIPRRQRYILTRIQYFLLLFLMLLSVHAMLLYAGLCRWRKGLLPLRQEMGQLSPSCSSGTRRKRK